MFDFIWVAVELKFATRFKANTTLLIKIRFKPLIQRVCSFICISTTFICTLEDKMHKLFK